MNSPDRAKDLPLERSTRAPAEGAEPADDPAQAGYDRPPADAGKPQAQPPARDTQAPAEGGRKPPG